MQGLRLLALDTNLHLLYLVASVDLVLLKKFKRVSRFSYEDVVALQELVDSFTDLVTTPHVLTEVSNFVDQAPFPWRIGLINELRAFTATHDERYEPAAKLMQRSEFAPLGLTDTALLSLAENVTVATLDYELYGRMLRAGRDAVHFDTLRGKPDA